MERIRPKARGSSDKSTGIRLVGRKYSKPNHPVTMLSNVPLLFKVRTDDEKSRDYFIGSCHLAYCSIKPDGYYFYLVNASEETALRGRFFKDEKAGHEWLVSELIEPHGRF